MILVTGAAGLVGGNLVRALLEKGSRVRVFIHEDQRAMDGLEVEIIRGEICDREQMARACAGVELVYHLAGRITLEMIPWQELEAVNVHGTRCVVEACLQAGVKRLVHFSSIHALRQDPLDQPVDEHRPPADSLLGERPGAWLSPYDLSKALGEREVRAGIARGLDAIILNPTGIVGPFDFKPSYFGQAVCQMAGGKLPALVTGGFDWVDVRDVVWGAIRAAETAPRGAQYILGGHWYSVSEVAALVSAAAGRPAPWLTVPLALAEATVPLVELLARFNGGHPLYTRVSLSALRSNRQICHDLAENALGYHPRPFAETVADTVAWFDQHGYFTRKGAL